MAWVGWLRDDESSPWRRVCEAEGLGECHRLLLAAADREGLKKGVNRIMTGGGYPFERRREGNCYGDANTAPEVARP